MKRRALISVSDKTGVVEFAQKLSNLGYEIISTGGTKKILNVNGVKTISIDEVTNFPEMLDGRVKTLHPKIHAGLLALRDNVTHQTQIKENNIAYIDIVCVNLYPFKQTITKPNFTHKEAIENIDIGGPSIIRSSAKNYQFVTVVTDSNDYDLVINEIKEFNSPKLETKEKLAAKAFRLTASYDALIQEYFTNYVKEDNPERITLTYDLKQTLRYGENPHQQGIFYANNITPSGIANTNQIHGKELSYNNISDANAAMQIISEFKDIKAVVVVKHSNPCAVAVDSNIDLAYQKAYDADPISIFGGIVILNDEVSERTAIKLNKIFLEIIIAPSFAVKALEILKKKANLRLLTYDINTKVIDKQVVSVGSGLLVQDTDKLTSTLENIRIVTKTNVFKEKLNDCFFAEKVVKHVKSNAIVVVKDGQTLGVGIGQTNRIAAAKLALEQAGPKAKGAVLGSDAFFPMDDTVKLAFEYGITTIIQPGGSIKDQDSINMCDNHGIAMIFTGQRHFKH